MRLITCVTVLAALLVAAVPAAASDRAAAVKAADWLASVDASPGGNAADTVVALRAAGRLSTADAQRRATALRSGAAVYATTAGATAKTILGLVAARAGNPRCAGPIDLLARLDTFRKGGRYGQTAWDQALSIAAVKALGGKPPRSAATRLLSTRGKGGWNFTLDRADADDVTHTALALIALRAAGVKRSEAGVRAGVRWLLSQRAATGGFAHQRRDRTEANATALAIEALAAYGRPDARATRALKSLQRSDGSVQFSATDAGSRELATVDAVVAFSGRYLPVAPLSRRAAAC